MSAPGLLSGAGGGRYVSARLRCRLSKPAGVPNATLRDVTSGGTAGQREGWGGPRQAPRGGASPNSRAARSAARARRTGDGRRQACCAQWKRSCASSMAVRLAAVGAAYTLQRGRRLRACWAARRFIPHAHARTPTAVSALTHAALKLAAVCLPCPCMHGHESGVCAVFLGGGWLRYNKPLPPCTAQAAAARHYSWLRS